jgi:hypothetical protein
MFGRTRKRQFEKAVLEEVAYMLDLHGPTPRALEAAKERAERENLTPSRVRVISEAAARLEARIISEEPSPASPAGCQSAPALRT